MTMLSRKSDRPVEAVARSFQILEELNRNRVTSVQMLHVATKLPKSTIVRLLKTLGTIGYVANDRRQGGYALTSRVQSLSNGFHGDPLVVEAARPWAIAFTAQYRWPTAIAVLDRDAVIVRFSTIPDSPISPFHGTINLRLGLLTRALGRAYLAFCPSGERSMLLDLLAASKHGEDRMAQDRKRTLWMLSTIRRTGFAERDPTVEPRSSNTIAVPIMIGDKVSATVGMTYFASAVSRQEIVEKYAEPMRLLAANIAASVAALR